MKAAKYLGDFPKQTFQNGELFSPPATDSLRHSKLVSVKYAFPEEPINPNVPLKPKKSRNQ